MIEIKQSELIECPEGSYQSLWLSLSTVKQRRDKLAEQVALRDEMASDLSRASASVEKVTDWRWKIGFRGCGYGKQEDCIVKMMPSKGDVDRRLAERDIQRANDIVRKYQEEASRKEEEFAGWRSEHLGDLAELSVEELAELEGQTSVAKLTASITDVQTESETLAELAGDAERAAWIRGEIRHSCRCNRDGHSSVDIAIGEHVIRVTLDAMDDVQGARHVMCELRQGWNLAGMVGKDLPEHFRYVGLHQLKPWPKSPVPLKEQAKAIAAIPSRLPQALRGWMMVGPPGTSKSTYAAAGVRDWLTWRIATDAAATKFDEDRKTVEWRAAFYQIHVPDWLEEMQAWEHRDFGDDSVVEPDYTPRNITASARENGLRPILLLEEIDKFTPTDNRRQLLFRLVDAVYRSNGVIVTTANTPLQKLEEMVGEPVFRRLSGTNDSDESYMVWDSFRLVPKKQKTH